MSLVLQSSGGGQITIQEPNTASNFTQTLPAATGTVTLSDGSGNLSVSGNLSFNSGYGSSAVAYGCRAWVNFDGTGTPAIRASGNVSSITDNGLGDYTVNFTTAMPDANYAWSGSATNAANSNIVMGQNAPTAPTASALRINTAQAGVSLADMQYVSISVFR
jgi:hypothetical protein